MAAELSSALPVRRRSVIALRERGSEDWRFDVNGKYVYADALYPLTQASLPFLYRAGYFVEISVVSLRSYAESRERTIYSRKGPSEAHPVGRVFLKRSQTTTYGRPHDLRAYLGGDDAVLAVVPDLGCGVATRDEAQKEQKTGKRQGA